MTISDHLANQLLGDYSLKNRVYALATEPSRITLEECATAIWQTNVCKSYWSAQIIAETALAKSGNEIVSRQGKFWKRTKNALVNAIIAHSDIPDSVMETNAPRVWNTQQWDYHLEILRVALSHASGKDESAMSRVYATFPARSARLLGQWFSLHRDSCNWTMSPLSWKQLIATNGYMLRGLWSSKVPLIKLAHECRVVDNHPINVPQFIDYRGVDHPTHVQHVVRALIQPLDNGLIAFYNGYKARITNRQFDFTTVTRHMMEEINGEVLPTITNDFVKHFSEATGVPLGVRQVQSSYSQAYINGDKWYLVGPVDHPIMVRNSYQRRHFHDIVTLPSDYEENDYGMNEPNYLDYGWNKLNANDIRMFPVTEYGLSWGSYDRRNQ